MLFTMTAFRWRWTDHFKDKDHSLAGSTRKPQEVPEGLLSIATIRGSPTRCEALRGVNRAHGLHEMSFHLVRLRDLHPTALIG
jgi:hypothetical protein